MQPLDKYRNFFMKLYSSCGCIFYRKKCNDFLHCLVLLCRKIIMDLRDILSDRGGPFSSGSVPGGMIEKKPE